MMTIYGFPNSRSIRPMWALEEVRADYRFVKVDLAKGEGRAASYLALNPSGKVPVLVEDEFVLTESAAICTYVGDRLPASGLTPTPGSRERALYNQWCYFAIGELEQPLWTMAKHRFALPQEWRVPAVIETAAKEFAAALKVLESGLGAKPFIVGESFSAADILLGHTLGWARKYEIPMDSPAILAYVDRTLARPALARARLREQATA